MPRQLSCRGMCKIVTWSDQYFSGKSNMYFYKDLDYELINPLWAGPPGLNSGQPAAPGSRPQQVAPHQWQTTNHSTEK